MADDFSKRNKDAKEFYETQMNIAETIKRQTDNWTNFNEATKEGAKNAKKIKETQAEINRLIAEGSDESKQKAAQLQKELDYLKEYNKELLKTKTLIQASGKALGKWGMDQLSKGATSLLDMYNKMDKSARRTSISMGMSINRMNTFKTIAAGSAEQLTILGLETSAAGEMMGAFAEETGRQTMLSQESVEAMGALSQRIGISHQEMAGLAGQMQNFGFGAQDSVELISNISDMSDKMGVNTQKVIKKVQTNLKLVNKLSFKGGVKGMAQMAAYSEKYKLSMEAVAGFADKVFRPEGAIDAAANLQVLGGSLAQMGDPFQIMYQARNAPEELAKSITKAAAATAEWDEASKEFKVSAYELDRLKEASEATGIPLEELVTTAKETARINMFENMIGKGVGKDEKEFLSSIAEMRDGKAMVQLGVDKSGKPIYEELSKINNDQAKQLMEKKKNDEEAALAAQTTQERLANMWNSILAKLLPRLDAIEQTWGPMLIEWAKWFVDGIKYVLENPWVQKLVLGLMVLSKVGPILGKIFGPLLWIMRGRWLARGFNIGLKKNKVMDTLMGKQGGAGNMVQSKSGKMYSADSPQGKMIRTKGGTQPLGKGGGGGPGAMGQSAGSQATNMLKGAAAILILSAALFVFAKALQEFDKLQNGWGTLALAAVSLGVLAIGLFAISKIPSQNVLMGSLAIAALGVALIPFAYGMSLLADVGAGQMIGAAIALGLFALAAGLMAEFLPFILLGSLAIVVLSGAVALFGLAMGVAAPGFEAFIGAFERLPNLIAPMLLLGPALLGMAAGIAVLTISLLGFGLSWLVGGWAFEDMAESIGALGNADLSGLGTAVQAINSVDMNKLEALRDLASSLSLFSLFGGGINIEFGDLSVKGTIDIKGEAGGSKSTDWVEDPIFVSKLKDLVWETMEKDRNGGKP